VDVNGRSGPFTSINTKGGLLRRKSMTSLGTKI
jgi:hypothetical protein